MPALSHLIAASGDYPRRGTGAPPDYTMGMVHFFAGDFDPFGAPVARGQSLSLMQGTQLFSIIGTAFGGDGQRDFDLPDFRKVVAVGGPCGQIGPATLSMTWLIAADSGSSGFPVAGSLALFAGNFAPDGWLVADGTMLAGSAYPNLLIAIGTVFGGTGAAFALPDLTGCAPVGTGSGKGQPGLGDKTKGAVAGLGLNFAICASGIFPGQGGAGAVPDGGFIGQVAAFASDIPSSDWLACDGSVLPIKAYQPLATLLGTTYGGDGTTTFGLPDLRGQMVTGN